jgi:hypothetical protein
MIVLPIELNRFSLEVRTDAGKDGAQILKYFVGKDTSPVFSYEDQVHMKREYAMSAPSDIVVFHNRPTILQA